MIELLEYLRTHMGVTLWVFVFLLVIADAVKGIVSAFDGTSTLKAKLKILNDFERDLILTRAQAKKDAEMEANDG